MLLNFLLLGGGGVFQGSAAPLNFNFLYSIFARIDVTFVKSFFEDVGIKSVSAIYTFGRFLLISGWDIRFILI